MRVDGIACCGDTTGKAANVIGIPIHCGQPLIFPVTGYARVQTAEFLHFIVVKLQFSMHGERAFLFRSIR
jgi:hypothetical protein